MPIDRFMPGPSPKPGSPDAGKLYAKEADRYKEFAENSYSWLYLEKPAFDKYISDLYRPDTETLDLGCGTGRVITHLIEKGILPEHIVGLDTTEELLKMARAEIPGVQFEQADLRAGISLDSGIFDLVTSNMVFHHLSREELLHVFHETYRVLKPDGTFFFVATDPDYSAETRDPANVNTWTVQDTPWGTTAPMYNHHPYEVLVDSLYFAGFNLVSGWPLKVAEEGKVDPEQYDRYANQRSRRMAARLHKVSEEEKARRLEAGDRKIPPLVPGT